MAGKMKVSFWQNLKSDLAWLFSFNDIDDHYVIKLLGIKFCKKHGVGVNIDEVNELGVTLEKRTPQVIVSLTTFPARINTVYKTISTLLTQTVKPDRVVLWLTESQFPDKNLPENLTKLQEFGLEIKWVEKDIRSFKKLISSLKEFPEDIIITADDDIFYPENFVESLYSAYLENPKYIHANRAFVIKRKLNKKFYIKSRNYDYNKTYLPAFSNELMSGYGTLFPPHSLDKTAVDDTIFMNVMPTNDDIWAWGMAVLKGTKIMVNKNGYKLKLIEDRTVQGSALKDMNRNDTTVGMSGRDGVNKMCELYPKILENLTQERVKYTKDDFEAFILTYNRKEYLQESLKSLLNQSIGDLSITVMDNGSTDGTDSVMKELTEKYQNVHYHRREQNGKQIENFMDAVNLAQKEYVIFFHDDDILHSDYFKYALKAVNKYPDVSAISTAYKEYSNPTNENWEKVNGKCTYCPSQEDFVSYLYYIQNFAYPPTIYKVNNIKKHALKIEQYSKFGKMGDKPFVLDSVEPDEGAVMFKNKYFLRYRVHPGQDTQSSGPYYNEIIEYNKYCKDFMYQTLYHRFLYNLINYKQLKNAYNWGKDYTLSLNEFIQKAIDEGAGCFWTKLCISPCGKLFIEIAHILRKLVRRV